MIFIYNANSLKNLMKSIMVELPSKQPKGQLTRLVEWTRKKLETPQTKSKRILEELDKKKNDNYNPYKDSNELVATAKKLLMADKYAIQTPRTCLVMALGADPQHEEAKKLLEELENQY